MIKQDFTEGLPGRHDHVPADLGIGVVVVRRVRATICSPCGEEWIDDAVARRREQVVNEVRWRHREVDVTTFA